MTKEEEKIYLDSIGITSVKELESIELETSKNNIKDNIEKLEKLMG